MIELVDAMQAFFRYAILVGQFPLLDWPDVNTAYYLGSTNMRFVAKVWWN